MAEIIPEDINSLPLREKRLGHDLRGLIWDPPEGMFYVYEMLSKNVIFGQWKFNTMSVIYF